MVAQIHFYGGATESFVGQIFFCFGCFEEVGISSTGCEFVLDELALVASILLSICIRCRHFDML